MPEESTNTSEDRFAVAGKTIRDSAKWLIAAAAAVGAALIAGSQLSSIGQLDTCSGWSVQCTRLPLAVLGAIIGLGAVVFIVWSAAHILLPKAVTLDELQQHWENSDRWADGKFFRENPAYLSYPSPAELAEARTDAWNAKAEAEARLNSGAVSDRVENERLVHSATERFAELQETVRTVSANASYQLLKNSFERMLAKLIYATVVATLGILMFAWAANPPAQSTPPASLMSTVLEGADLRDANLKGVDLRDADLTGANLTGANLEGSRLEGVRWSGTICPDGTNSDSNDGSCRGHLK